MHFYVFLYQLLWSPILGQLFVLLIFTIGSICTTIFGFLPYITHVLNTLFAQPADIGAHPQLYAALHPGLAGGETVGPKYVSFGRAVIETDKFCDLGINAMNFRAESCNTSHLDALWKQSESITGIVY